MTDPAKRPQRVTTHGDDHDVVIYDFHVEIEVKASALDEKRLRKLIDERLELIGTALNNSAPKP